jgi:[ribosomal protein S5]-alanine N-acetyltransferase
MKPDLFGSRVIVRSIQMNDIDDLFEIYGNIKTMEFASDPAFISKDTVKEMLESVIRLEISGVSFEWAIADRTTNKVIGTCGIHSFSDCGQSCEVGCLLNSSYWQHGYMTEALSLLFSHSKSWGIKILFADIDEGNIRSQSLFKKLGFEAQSGQFQRTL